MVDLAVDGEADIGDDRDLWHDDRVILAPHLHVEPGRGETLAVRDGVHLVAKLGELARHGHVRPKLQVSVGGQGEPHSVGIEVIGVLMRHKHSVYPGQRVWAGPYTRIDDQRPAVFAQPDARVTKLRKLHDQKPSERPVAGQQAATPRSDRPRSRHPRNPYRILPPKPLGTLASGFRR